MSGESPASILYDAAGNPVAVLQDGTRYSLLTSQLPAPPVAVTTKMVPFRGQFTDSGGSPAMNVNGATTPVTFDLSAPAGADRYITHVVFQIEDAGAVINEFANVGVLTNGCRLFYELGGGSVDFHPSLKTNFDFVTMCIGIPSFGNGASAFRVTNANGNAEAYFPTWDLRAIMPPFGMLLRAGTTHRLGLEVRDNLTGATGFTATAHGFDRAP